MLFFQVHTCVVYMLTYLAGTHTHTHTRKHAWHPRGTWNSESKTWLLCCSLFPYFSTSTSFFLTTTHCFHCSYFLFFFLSWLLSHHFPLLRATSFIFTSRWFTHSYFRPVRFSWDFFFFLALLFVEDFAVFSVFFYLFISFTFLTSSLCLVFTAYR